MKIKTNIVLHVLILYLDIYFKFQNSKPDFVATLKGMLEELKVAEKCLVGEEEGRDGAIARSVLKMKNEVSEIILFSDFI